MYKQYLIGLTSPGLSGMGLSAGRLAHTLVSGFRGLHWYACAVYGASWVANSFLEGRSMMLSVPRKRPPMYCTVRLVESFGTGCGPSGLANEVTPLPFAMRSFRPLGVTRTDVGYQPAGMKPRERLLPGLVTSKTPTLWLSEFFQKTVLPQ